MEVFVDNEPFTRNEFYSWIQNSYGPHLEDEKVAHGRLEQVHAALFGDNNGDDGDHARLKKLICVANRVEHWLDGTVKLWKIGTAIILPIGAFAALAKHIGWL